MVDVAFTEARGGRPLNRGFPRVGIVVTDGMSHNHAATLAAAQRAHDADITMFAIGVGNPNIQVVVVVAAAVVVVVVVVVVGLVAVAVAVAVAVVIIAT